MDKASKECVSYYMTVWYHLYAPDLTTKELQRHKQLQQLVHYQMNLCHHDYFTISSLYILSERNMSLTSSLKATLEASRIC